MNTQLKTLTAQRIKETEGAWAGLTKTILRNELGEIVATYPASFKSKPSKKQKTIKHNCFTYNLIWED